MTIITPIRCPVIPALSFGINGVSLGGLPPVDDKLLLWSLGTVISGSDVIQDPDVAQDPDISYAYYRKDRISGFHMFVTPNGDLISNLWDTTIATYLIYHDILLIDPTPLITADALGTGPFFFDGAGNEVARTMAEIITHAATSDICFMCEHNGKYELRHYDDVLTGQELIDAEAWCD